MKTTGAGRAAHTPGPWQIQRESWPADAHAYDLLIESATDVETQGVHSGRRIAKVPRSLGIETSIANAQLIAAAPAMLAALKGLVNCHTGASWQTPEAQREWWLAATDAIKAAEGRDGDGDPHRDAS